MRLKKYIGTREFYRVLLAVTVPILIQNGITNFISLLDNVMVGQVGTEQMSGVSIVNQLLFVFNLCIFGAVSGVGLFGAQFFGKGDHEGIRHTFRFKLYCALALCAAAVLLLFCFGDGLIGLYLHEGGETGNLALTLQYAKQYLAISLIGLLPYTVTQVYASTLREIGHTLPPMTAGICGVAVNLIFNYILIFGHFGAPAMGVEGAAVATVLSRFVECGAVMIWAHANPQKCRFIKGVYRSGYVPAPLMKQIARLGIPLLLNETLWAAGQAMLLQAYSHRGIAVVSAMNITNTIFNTCSVLFLAVGSAISILLGHVLGAGKHEQARSDADRMIAFSLFMGVLTGVIVAIAAPLFPLLYNTTDEVRGLAVSFTLIMAIAAPLHACVNACYFTLRSGGKTLITFLFDSGYMWGVSVLLAMTLSRYTALPITAVYLICQAVDAFKAALGLLLVRRGIWVNDITTVT